MSMFDLFCIGDLRFYRFFIPSLHSGESLWLDAKFANHKAIKDLSVWNEYISGHISDLRSVYRAAYTI